MSPEPAPGVHDIKTVNVNAAADGANVILAAVPGLKYVVVGGVLTQTGAAASDLRASGGTVKMSLLAGTYPLDDAPMEFPLDEGISTNNGVGSDITGYLAYYEVKRNI